MAEMTCAEVSEAGPGFALDLLDPQDERDMLAHLDRCARCRDDMTRLRRSAHRLLDTSAPDFTSTSHFVELPPETPYHGAPTVVPAAAVPVRRRRVRTALAMAAAATLAVSSTLGPEIAQSGRVGAPVPAARVTLVGSGRPVGVAYLYPGHDPSIALEVVGMTGPGPLVCVLTTADGTSVEVGTVRVTHGRGYWAGARIAHLSAVSALSLLDRNRDVVASASV